MKNKETEAQCLSRVLNRMTEFKTNGNFGPASRFLDDELAKEKYVFLFYEKAVLLRLMGKSGEALQALEEGINEDITNHTLYRLKADILANDFLNSDDVRISLLDAQKTIVLARQYFDEYSKPFKGDFLRSFNSGAFLFDYVTELIEIRNIEINIRHLSSLLSVYTDINTTKGIVQQTEERIFTDRIRTVEILGLFVGIFAFIISSTQIAVNYPMVEAVSIIIAMGMVLLVFLFVLHLAFNRHERSWLYITLILFFLVIAMFVIPLLPDMIKGLKYKFGLM